MSKDRRIYICCVEDRKPYLMAKAKSILGREAVSEELEASTLVLVVGESSKQMEEEVIEAENSGISVATVYKGNIIKNLIMDCQSYTKYRPNETTGGIFVSWRGKEELPTGLD